MNVNNLPQSLIEHAKTIIDSASAVYGSDAAAEGIKFIQHNDFDGSELQVSANTTGEGDSEA